METRRALFADAERDSLSLFLHERSRFRAARQSPLRSEEHFFDSDSQLDREETMRMLQRYKPYWRRLLNKPWETSTDVEVYEIDEALKHGPWETEILRRLRSVLEQWLQTQDLSLYDQADIVRYQSFALREDGRRDVIVRIDLYGNVTD